MRCSSCGKEIPFRGDVCPFCQRDKSGDKLVALCAQIAAVVCGLIAVALSNVWGGLIVGLGIYFLVLAIGHDFLPSSAGPPEVMVRNSKPAAVPPKSAEPGDSSAARLRDLEMLRTEGLISEEEYLERRNAIIASL